MFLLRQYDFEVTVGQEEVLAEMLFLKVFCDIGILSKGAECTFIF